MDPWGQFDMGRDCSTQQARKISIALINSCPGKICLGPPVRIACGKRRAARQNPTSSPERQQLQAHATNVKLAACSNLEFYFRTRSPHLRTRSLRKDFLVKSIFTLPGQCTSSRLFSPASPTASPESEFVSHGRVASRGVCKDAPHQIRVLIQHQHHCWRLRR